ncbi:MAG: hypothetical protein WBF32_13855 [Candidatus Aminicenantaceae bacterium]
MMIVRSKLLENYGCKEKHRRILDDKEENYNGRERKCLLQLNVPDEGKQQESGYYNERGNSCPDELGYGVIADAALLFLFGTKGPHFLIAELSCLLYEVIGQYRFR